MIAAMFGNVDCAEALLARGAPVCALPDGAGYDALVVASHSGALSMVKLLLQHDTSPAHRDFRYGRCAQIACERDYRRSSSCSWTGVPLEASGEYRHGLLETAISQSYGYLQLLYPPTRWRDYPQWSAFQCRLRNDLKAFGMVLGATQVDCWTSPAGTRQ
jgi:ankyrin repeat protein